MGVKVALSMIEQDIYSNAAGFRAYTDVIVVETSSAPQFIDITDDVVDVVGRSGILNGLASVFSRHTTAAIKINEHEPELLKDMARFLTEIAPAERDYCHNNFDVRTVNMTDDECPNAHSHCQHLMLGTSETIPVVNGQLHLGRWQRLFLIELDQAKTRQVVVQVLGL